MIKPCNCSRLLSNFNRSMKKKVSCHLQYLQKKVTLLSSRDWLFFCLECLYWKWTSVPWRSTGPWVHHISHMENIEDSSEEMLVKMFVPLGFSGKCMIFHDILMIYNSRVGPKWSTTVVSRLEKPNPLF